MKHNLANIQKEQIVENIISALNRHEEIVAAYFFGSFVRTDTFSDIDVGLLIDDEINSALDYELKLEIELENIIGYPVDIRNLNHAPLSFCYQVIRHGRIIIDKKPNLRAEFTGYILKKYFDFAPYRRRYLHEVSHAPI